MTSRKDADAALLAKCGLAPTTATKPTTPVAELPSAQSQVRQVAEADIDPSTGAKPTVLPAVDAAVPTAATIQYEAHPIAACWQPIEGGEFAALCTSVKEHGLLQPITLYEGKILDGCNRLRACHEIGITPKFTTYTGNDPLGFALAANEVRRHMDTSRRAMVGARLAQLPKGANQHASRDASSDVSQSDAADLMHVGRTQVQRARLVQQRAVPELVAAVDHGLITVAAAAKLVETPVEDQKAIAAKLAEGCPARAAVREVQGDREKGPVKDAPVSSGLVAAPNRTESAAALEAVYLAYKSLAPADQDRHFRRIKTERAKADALKAAAAEAAEEAVFREKVARANAGCAKAVAATDVSHAEPTSAP